MRLRDGEMGRLYQINMNSDFWDGVVCHITDTAWHQEVTIEIVRTNLLGVAEVGSHVIGNNSDVGLAEITTMGKLEDYPEYLL